MTDASDASFYGIATSNRNNITVPSLKQLQLMITEWILLLLWLDMIA